MLTTLRKNHGGSEKEARCPRTARIEPQHNATTSTPPSRWRKSECNYVVVRLRLDLVLVLFFEDLLFGIIDLSRTHKTSAH